jgi:hypothetical protein
MDFEVVVFREADALGDEYVFSMTLVVVTANGGEGECAVLVGELEICSGVGRVPVVYVGNVLTLTFEVGWIVVDEGCTGVVEPP